MVSYLLDRRRLDQNGEIHVRTVGGATAGDISATLANQSPRKDTRHMLLATMVSTIARN